MRNSTPMRFSAPTTERRRHPYDDGMTEALALARLGEGLTSPNPMVGALVISRRNMLVGYGYHAGAGTPHAEAVALRRAGDETEGGTLFVSLEPCSTWGRTPPCTDAIIGAGIARVIIGAPDPNPKHAGRGMKLLEEAGIEVIHGVMEREARALNEDFFKWITTGKPYVTLKMAMTLDGKIATCGGQSQWITGEAARKRVQQLRRRADAILVSGETLRCDRPQLTVREPAGWARQPRRIIASRTMNQAEVAGYFSGGVMPEAVDIGDWGRWLEQLGSEEVMSLLIEGGGGLAAAALCSGEVDAVEFHIAPKILGGRNSRPVVGGADPAALAEALELDEVTVEAAGNDMIYRGKPRKPSTGKDDHGKSQNFPDSP